MEISKLIAIASIAGATTFNSAPARAACDPDVDMDGTWYWNMAWFDETGAYNQGTFPNDPEGVYGNHADIGTEACKVQVASNGNVVPAGSSCIFSDNRDDASFDIGFSYERVVGGHFEVSNSCEVTGVLALWWPEGPYVYYVRIIDARMDSGKSMVGFTAVEAYPGFLGTYSYQGTMTKQP